MIETAFAIRVTGRVQGVGFRAWTVRRALALGLRGWVRNEPDGSVSALIGGPREPVERMLELLRIGPSHAKVADVSAKAADLAELPRGFGQVG